MLWGSCQLCCYLLLHVRCWVFVVKNGHSVLDLGNIYIYIYIYIYISQEWRLLNHRTLKSVVSHKWFDEWEDWLNGFSCWWWLNNHHHWYLWDLLDMHCSCNCQERFASSAHRKCFETKFPQILLIKAFSSVERLLSV